MKAAEPREQSKATVPDVQEISLKTRLYKLYRRIALLGPTEEEMDRMDEEDCEANTIRVPGTDGGIVVGLLEFGARVDPNDPYIGKYFRDKNNDGDKNERCDHCNHTT